MPWVNPPPFGVVGDYSNIQNLALNSTVTLQWTDAPNLATIWLFKDGDEYLCRPFNLAKTFCYPVLPAFQKSNSFDWVVQTYNSTYSTANTFYYLVIRDNQGSSTMYSHYFNILPGELIKSSSTSTSISATTSQTSASSRSSGTASTAIASDGTATSAPAAVTSNSDSSGMAASTKTAVGVAVGIGIPLILVLLAIAFLLYRKSHCRNSTTRGKSGRRVSTPPAYRDVMKPELEDMPSKPAMEYSDGRHCATISVIRELDGSQAPYRPSQNRMPAELSNDRF